ncbi:dihydroxyacetone kinase subunit DhaL [Anaerotruncus rubiinfantis]|uniref:dihydroxyacetone kinase subunit DhaL n=1 Tax=Anaerotruncus rubiinfantis TaxID=1720200 RepID=UPI00082C943A|nr:dihydroxyacetone kinase subunit DhaL [Anaerotruncus rubiinfantis]
METLNAAAAREMLLCAADAIIRQKSLLTELDSQIGDGDHGIGMARGMKKAQEALGKLDGESNVYQCFSDMGKAMLLSMGGASGVIFGTMFMGGTKGHEPQSNLSSEEFVALMTGSLRAIKDRGKAAVGDKTMVDAFEPAVDAMRAHANEGFAAMLAAAAAAAEQGAKSTKAYQAKFGRAKSLMERAVGHMDSGAVSTAIIFRAMSDYMKNSGWEKSYVKENH